MADDRLDRIEAILARLAESQVEADKRLSRAESLQVLTQQQIDSNARSIAAWENRFTEIEEDAEEATSSTRADLSERIEGLRRQADDDWTRFDQRHEEHAQRFNTLLEEVRADRLQMDQFIQSSTENIQTLFAEVSRIWQRLAG